jgi:Fe-S-cluster-containing hydrogenase component 2
VGAISAGVLPESGSRVLQVDEGKCVGCRMCVLACPFGNIEVRAPGRAEKCDLCGGDPVCVQFCPRGALRFGETVDVEGEKRDKWAKALADTYRESE